VKSKDVARWALVLGLTCASGLLQSQSTAPLEKELRLDGVVGRADAAQIGGGLQVSADYYTRIGLVAATGVATDGHGARSASRVDLVARFLLDPFRESPHGISLGGGISASNTQSGHWRPYLVGLIDFEGRKTGAVAPAIQLGLGGGVRLGVILRSAANGWR